MALRIVRGVAAGILIWLVVAMLATLDAAQRTDLGGPEPVPSALPSVGLP